MPSAHSLSHLKRIAILHHKDQPADSSVHLIALLRHSWRKAGIDVVDLRGTTEFLPADILIVHVDRTIVPQEYAAFASKYPFTVNAAATDIRKHRYADGLLNRTSEYTGPVIVKSDLNYGGLPEIIERYHSRPAPLRAVDRLSRVMGHRNAPPILSKEDYRIYPSLQTVPSRYFRKDYIIQKFMPERENGRYLLREYYFMGNKHYQSIEASSAAVFTDDEIVGISEWNPPPELLALRENLGLNYGKIDFVLVEGKPFVFDANKTMGLGHVVHDADDLTLCNTFHPAYCAMADGLAAGLLEKYGAEVLATC